MIRKRKKPMRTDHIFRIASQTKAITSVAVMMLYEEGKFLLDEPVSKYIPEMEGQQVLSTFNKADSSLYYRAGQISQSPSGNCLRILPVSDTRRLEVMKPMPFLPKRA